MTPFYDETLVEDKCETPPGKKPKIGKPKPKSTNKPGGTPNSKNDLMLQLKKAEATAEERVDSGESEEEGGES